MIRLSFIEMYHYWKFEAVWKDVPRYMTHFLASIFLSRGI